MSLVERLSAAAAKMGPVSKNGFNSFHKYEYATHNDVSEAVRASLFSQGVIMLLSIDSHSTEDSASAKGRAKRLHTVWFTATFVYGEEKLSIQWIGQSEDTEDKGIAKAMSSGVKSMLLKVFLIPADDPDNDTDAYPRKQSEPKKPETKAPPDPMFCDLPKERRDKARAQFWALAGELDLDEAGVYDACHQLALDRKKGRRSLNASTVRQVGDAINMLRARRDAALSSASGIAVSDKTREALAENPAWPQLQEEEK